MSHIDDPRPEPPPADAFSTAGPTAQPPRRSPDQVRTSETPTPRPSGASLLAAVNERTEEFIGTEEQRIAFYTAFALAQGEFLPIEKNKIGKIKYESKDGRQGGEYAFKYADMAAVLNATRPALSKHGIGLMQPPLDHSGGLWLKTILTHKSGGRFEVRISLNTARGSDPKKEAAIVSYWRRYSVTGVLGVAADDDIDDMEEDTSNVEDDLLVQAHIAAESGTQVFDKFFRALSKNERASLMSRHEALMEKARDADKLPAPR